MNENNAMIQIKKGTLEFCVLAIIDQEECYGYEIAKLLTEKGLATQEGTIYPLLARLKKEKLVTTSWQQNDPQGVPRKYYRVTPRGKEALINFKENWKSFSRAVQEILG